MVLLMQGASLPATGVDDAIPGSGPVQILKTPHSGIQPQAVMDADGTLHLIYFAGDPAQGNLFYVRREANQDRFSAPVRVNSQAGSVVAIGSIRGGQIAIGKGKRIHVAWNGARGAKPENPAGGSPMLYARSTSDSGAVGFEEQRNLMLHTTALDGGGSVAADQQGHVYVAWHGRAEGGPEGEAWRGVWVARSDDEGASFTKEYPTLDRPTGACACCGTRALVDSRGTFYMLYRAATAGVERDMTLITSANRGNHFQRAALSPWRLGTCPMSSSSLTETSLGVIAAWETNGQVFWSRIDPATLAISEPITPPGSSKARKHPAVAESPDGTILLVWTEGTGWQKGGALAWQTFDRSGKPKGAPGRLEGGVPVWGVATVVAKPEGGFLVVH
jgi:hypothetical protein